nr:transmembrane protein 247-like [Zootoca vivipara]
MYLAEVGYKEVSREPHCSSDFSNFETESVHQRDKEIQADLDRTSNVEGSEYSYQGGSVGFKEMQTEIEFAVQITPIKDLKKHRERMDANGSGSPAIPAIVTDTLANGDQQTPLGTRRQLEATSSPLPLDAVAKEEKDEHREDKDGQGAKEQEQVPRIVVSGGGESEWSSSRLNLANETELEKRRMEFELTRLKYEHEENERQRQHEEKMEQLRQQQAPPKKIGQQLHELLQPQNEYALFFFCFIFIHFIYTARELAFYFIMKHDIFCFAILMCFVFKKILLDYISGRN